MTCKAPFANFVVAYIGRTDQANVAPHGAFHRFVAADDPNKFIALSDGNNSLTPITDPSDNASGFTTRLISGATKSTNSGDITFDSDELIIALRPGSGFVVTRSLFSVSLQAVTSEITLDMTGPNSADQFAALWAVG